MSHRALSPQQFDIAQIGGLHPSLGGGKVPELLGGRAARHVMARAGIRQTRQLSKPGNTGDWWPATVDAPHIAGVAEGYGEYGHPRGEVWTSQTHLHTPTLRRYMSGDVPKLDPDIEYMREEGHDEGPSQPYEPETYEHGGKTWLAEGHHRTIARRLGYG